MAGIEASWRLKLSSKVFSGLTGSTSDPSDHLTICQGLTVSSPQNLVEIKHEVFHKSSRNVPFGEFLYPSLHGTKTELHILIGQRFPMNRKIYTHHVVLEPVWNGIFAIWWFNLWSIYSRWRNPTFFISSLKSFFWGGKQKKNTFQATTPPGSEIAYFSHHHGFSGRYFWGFHCEYCAEQSVLEAFFFNSCLRYRYKSDQLNAKNTQRGGYMTKITYFNDRKLGGWRQNSETSVAGSKVKRGFNLGCHDMDGGT